jgi:hypothetical protein
MSKASAFMRSLSVTPFISSRIIKETSYYIISPGVIHFDPSDLFSLWYLLHNQAPIIAECR